MAEAAWRARLRQLAVSADDLCQFAAQHLVAAFIHLQDPIDVASAAEGTVEAARDKLKAGLDSLRLAAGASSLAAADMLAAELIGLRGASATPAHPLAAVDEIDDKVLRTGLTILRAAFPLADDAFHLIKVARTHLRTIDALLDLDGMAELIDGERGLALTALFRASDLVQRFSEHAGCARELL